MSAAGMKLIDTGILLQGEHQPLAIGHFKITNSVDS
jgi:hypothetical protein